VGPYLVGWIRDATGGFTAGLLTLAAILVIGAAITLAIVPPTRK
jgi:cyanate permease